MAAKPQRDRIYMFSVSSLCIFIQLTLNKTEKDS